MVGWKLCVCVCLYVCVCYMFQRKDKEKCDPELKPMSATKVTGRGQEWDAGQTVPCHFSIPIFSLMPFKRFMASFSIDPWTYKLFPFPIKSTWMGDGFQPLRESHPIIFPQNVGSILQLKPSRFSPRARSRKNKCTNQVTNILQRGSADYGVSVRIRFRQMWPEEQGPGKGGAKGCVSQRWPVAEKKKGGWTGF